MIENCQWTPRQISEDITIPQLVSLWFKDEAEGWQTVGSLAEAREIVLRKARAKQEKEKADADTG